MGSKPKHVKGDIFEAKDKPNVPEKKKPTEAQKKASVQPTPKKSLTHEVYDQWREITFKALTPNGEQAVYTVNPQDGDGKIVFHHLKANQTDSVKRADNISLTGDGQFVVFKIKPPQKLMKDLRRIKKKKEVAEVKK